jgi:hypothetical protein
MRYANFLEKRIESLVLTPPICLHSNNFLAKESLYMMLKITKFLKHIRFLFQEINPGELAIIINQTEMIFIMPTEAEAGPQTSENTNLRGKVETLDDLG